MSIAAFNAPGDLTDLDDAGSKQWSDFISEVTDQAIAGRTDHTNDRPRAQYFNLTKVDTGPDAASQRVSWIAFPRGVKLHSVSDKQRWQRADASRDVQDEYCEWSVTRRPDGKIQRVTFTCEGPEYWEVLAATRPDLVVQLYQEFIDPAVQHDDLFDASGGYIRRNKWNSTTTNGAMHLVQASNTLGAEIELAAAATIVRARGDHVLAGEQELIECSEYGAPDRNSDPHIGGVVNSVARQKADVALSDPVGLYLGGLSTAGWKTPDGSDPQSYWKILRGSDANPVRAVYEVSHDTGFTVSDIQIQGRPIVFGAQITDFISVRLTAVGCRFGQSTTEPMPCVGPLPPGQQLAAPSVAMR
jgi:hypothetical protein